MPTDTAPIGFLFDMDGVICDNNAFHKSTWLEYARRLGKELTDEDIVTKVYGKTNTEILAYVLEREVVGEELNHHAEAKEALFREQYKPHFALMDGLEAFLSRAKELGVRLGLATNAPESNLTFTQVEGKLERFFDYAAHAAMVTNPKPAPDIYLHVASALGVDPHRCIVFEDSLTGMAAARAAGCQVVGIASTLPFDKLQQLAERVVRDFTGISPEECVTLAEKNARPTP